METKILHQSHPDAISTSLNFLSQNELIAFPTDTVYGVGCLVDDFKAIKKIYTVKGRDTMKAIPVLIASLDHLSLICQNFTDNAARLAIAFWPGALTLILPKKEGLPANLSPYSTLGVRMPNHPFALSLINASGPLAATSANRSGEANPLNVTDVMNHLGGSLPLIIDGGASPGEIPSTVVECAEKELKILRQGAITRLQLEDALR